MDFDRRCVIVTGGAGALGREVVQALLAAGAECHVPLRGRAAPPGWDDTAHLTLVPDVDLTAEADVDRLYRGADGLWASIHLAGGFDMAPLADTGRAELQRMLDTNLVSALLCCRAAARAFGDRGGRIVNVGARAALEPRSGAGKVAYVASKAAVAAMTEALAAELAPKGILVNAVAPSVIDTPANRQAMPDADHATWPTPAQIAQSIVFLASPANTVTSGAIVPVYGRA